MWNNQRWSNLLNWWSWWGDSNGKQTFNGVGNGGSGGSGGSFGGGGNSRQPSYSTCTQTNTLLNTNGVSSLVSMKQS